MIQSLQYMCQYSYSVSHKFLIFKCMSMNFINPEFQVMKRTVYLGERLVNIVDMIMLSKLTIKSSISGIIHVEMC